MTHASADWVLVSLSTLPRPWLWTACLAVVAATLYVLWRYRRQPHPTALLLLRALGGLLVIGFVLEPALVRRSQHRAKQRLAVVVDRSRSMQLPADASHSRIDTARALLQNSAAALTALEERFVVQWHDLDGPIVPAALETPPDGAQTDLLGALERVTGAAASQALGAVVLLSDGADHSDLADAQGALTDAANRRLAGLQVPVNTVALGADHAMPDLALSHVAFDAFAFVHNTLNVEATLNLTGLPAQKIAVTLLREGKPIVTQEVDVRPNQPTVVRFVDRPDKVGAMAYSVQVPKVAGDALPHNNARHFVVQVARDKTRVLQVAGRPSWDERFLRQYLQNNPNVDLISFFILRTPDDDMSVSEQELSLIPFPVGKLFTCELASFDVVVFQNFDFRLYQMQSYLQNIHDAVERGLGFVMVGGSDSFAEGGYGDTPLEAILPVRLPREPAAGLLLQPLEPLLTEAGTHHPVTDLTLGTGSVQAAWQGLPAWTGANRIAGVAPGAASLVHDANLRDAQGQPMPLIAAMDVGAGRSVALATDASWRWRFHKSDGGRGERAYNRLWSNILRFLVRDPEHERVLVTLGKAVFEPQERVPLQISALGRDYKPVPFAHLRLTVSKVGEAPLATTTAVAGELGNLQHTLPSQPEGAYRAVVQAFDKGEKLGEGAAVFVVQTRSAEWLDGATQPGLLRDIARATHGESLQPNPQAWEKLAYKDSDVVELDRRQTVELWDNGLAFVVAALVWSGEWALRRRRGLT